VLSWCRGGGRELANNSVRNRVGLARTFLRWCDRRGIGPELDLEEEFAVIRRAFPATYGKVQDRHPARYLDQHQVESLLAACVDGTWQGSRDQVAIRLGLLGIRVAELCRLTWSNLLPDGTVAWIGKGRRPRQVRIGPVFESRLERWERAYAGAWAGRWGPTTRWWSGW
jgi:integrase